VIVSTETAGRLLGRAAHAPDVVRVVEDLLVPETGLAISERTIDESEVGSSPRQLDDVVLGVVRDGRVNVVGFNRIDRLARGDRVVVVRAAGAGRSRHQ
jgi:voltage-gated potassium channel